MNERLHLHYFKLELEMDLILTEKILPPVCSRLRDVFELKFSIEDVDEQEILPTATKEDTTIAAASTSITATKCYYSGASIPPGTMMHFPLLFQISPLFSKNFRTLTNFFKILPFH